MVRGCWIPTPRPAWHSTMWHSVAWDVVVWGGTAPVCPWKCHKECHWPCQGEASTSWRSGSIHSWTSCCRGHPHCKQHAPHCCVSSSSFSSSSWHLCSSWPCWETWGSPASGTGELQLAPVPGSCCQPRLWLSRLCHQPIRVFGLQTDAAGVSLQTAAAASNKEAPAVPRCGQSHAAAGHHRPGHCPMEGGWQQGSVPGMQQRPCCTWHRWELIDAVPMGCRGCPWG